MLEDALERYGHASTLTLELKEMGFGRFTNKIVAEVVRLVRKYGLEKKVIVCSWNPFVLKSLKEAAPEIIRSQIYAATAGSSPSPSTLKQMGRRRYSYGKTQPGRRKIRSKDAQTRLSEPRFYDSYHWGLT